MIQLITKLKHLNPSTFIKLNFCFYPKKNFELIKINHRTFSEEKQNTKLEENLILSDILIKEKLNLTKLTINLLKYLENNFKSYEKLCEDSIQLSYDIAEASEQSEFLKNELVRVNKQINNYSRDNNYYDEFKNLLNEILSTEMLIKEANEIGDDEIKKSAIKDLTDLKKQLETLQAEIIEYLIPDQEGEIQSISMEVKSAAGGTEGALFAEDLVEMYKKFCLKMGFDFNIVSYSSDFALKKGCKNGTFKIRGDCVFKYFQYESGVHKVQRVPITEKSGRIHSSTCQVAIFPDKEFAFEDIDERDLRIEYFRASGAGGQHVNKTESAVRLTHIPTGIVVQNQDERDQIRNKAKAMETLKSRLYNRQLSQFKEEINDSRRSQHGTGNLSEKIRTYNWPDSRITDHRLGITLYGIDQMLQGEHLETILEGLIEKERIEKLNNVLKRLDQDI